VVVQVLDVGDVDVQHQRGQMETVWRHANNVVVEGVVLPFELYVLQNGDCFENIELIGVNAKSH
jgi:hypothetical protein